MTLVAKQKFANVVILYIAFNHTCYVCADITMYKPYLINTCNYMLIIKLVGIMLQISIIFYSKFLLKSLDYAQFYSFYATDSIIVLQLTSYN